MQQQGRLVNWQISVEYFVTNKKSLPGKYIMFSGKKKRLIFIQWDYSYVKGQRTTKNLRGNTSKG